MLDAKFGFVGTEKVKIRDICEVVSGSTPKTSVEEYWDGELDWITPAELSDDSYIVESSVRKITQLGAEKTGLKSFPANTVILSSRAPIGKVAIAGKEMYCNQGFKNLICSEKIFPKYLFWFLKGKNEYLNSLGRGATFKEISKSIVENIEVSLPTIEEQLQIVEKFETIKNVIRDRKSQMKELDTLIKARFVEMFGDPIHNDKGWDTDSVSAVCVDIFGGGTPSKAHPEYYENGDIPWVSSKDMKTDVITESQIYINQLGLDNSSAKMVPVNSVIMVIRSGILKHTLPVAINAVPITVNQDLKVFIPNNRILTRFLAIQFKMLEADILTGVRAVTADNIEFETLKKRSIIVPPIKLQQEYIDFVAQTDKLKLFNQDLYDTIKQIDKGGSHENEF